MNCQHELHEMETACADGLCPLCLQARLARVVEAIQVLTDCSYWENLTDYERAMSPAERAALATLSAAAQPEAHPFEPCLEDEDTLGHNFTCALLCTVCGLTREKHAAAQPEKESP